METETDDSPVVERRRRRGCFAFVGPQIVFGLLGAFVGIANRLVTSWGGVEGFWDGVLDGRGALPAARIGPEILVVVVALVFAALLVVVFTFTLEGLLAGFVGWLGGLVFGGLYDVVRLRGPMEPDDPFVIKRVAGYGSVVALAFSVFAAFQMSIRDAAGIFCVTGFLAWMLGGAIGIVAYWVRRRRAV